ncbi:MAG: hypothetical protein C4562_07475 [Actinobacteria bacterium]|nr:MAG: hypothetical protein C4562_07475 [Actinomycetota bacterium]
MEDCWIVSLGQIPYPIAFRWQQQLSKQRLMGSIPSILMLYEHPLTITVSGRAALEEISNFSILESAKFYKSKKTEIFNRGQLVMSYIFDRRAINIDQYLSQLQQTVTLSLGALGIISIKTSNIGIWINGKRVGFLDTKERGMSIHSFRLNICNDISAFHKSGCNEKITSISEVLKYKFSVEDFKHLFKVNLERVFNSRFDFVPHEELNLPKPNAYSLSY